MNTTPNAPYDKEIYKSTLKEGRIRISLLLYMAVVVTITCGLVGITLARQGSTVEAIRSTQQEGSPLLRQMTTVTDTIQDCVEPTGECYQNGQKRTAAILANVGSIVAATMACADKLGVQDYNEINECVITTIKENS